MDNHDWLKDCTKSQLLGEFRDYGYKEVSGGLADLWVHQLVCLLLVDVSERFMLHVDMGGGKTSVVLFSINLRKMRGEKPRVIVLVPYITAIDSWVTEAKKRTPSLSVVPLINSTIDNHRLVTDGTADVYVGCYASMVAMLAEKHPTKKGWYIDPDNAQRTFAAFDTFVADEVHKCSNTSTLTYQLCRTISRNCRYGIGLSGTPFGKNVLDIWSQFQLIDFGETLGPKGMFQEAFFTKKKRYFGGPYAFDYIFQKQKMPLLKAMVKNKSIHYAAEEMHDLPMRRYIQRRLPLPSDIGGYVQAASHRLNEAVGHKDTVQRTQLVEATYLQLRQLASGFMTVPGDEGKIKVAFDNNPKLDLLEEYLDAMPSESKMVVFHHFVYTNELISKRLTKLKIKHARIWSGQKAVLQELERFRADPDVRVLVLNDQSGSNSLNLQNANYMFFFEEPDSPINRQQGERRIWRPGQTKPVFYIDPFMEGTVDERIYHSNTQGKKLLDSLLKGDSNELAEVPR
jgi:SNF2 family DNA or RNA helicase